MMPNLWVILLQFQLVVLCTSSGLILGSPIFPVLDLPFFLGCISFFLLSLFHYMLSLGLQSHFGRVFLISVVSVKSGLSDF